MDTGIALRTYATTKGKLAFLFLLATLMLVVSCPVKRLLQAQSSVQAWAQKSVKWNGAGRQETVHKNTSCYVQKQKITRVEIAVSNQEQQTPGFSSDQNVQAGFGLHYFLSGTEMHASSAISTSVSPLPLFLQHRRLLI